MVWGNQAIWCRESLSAHPQGALARSQTWMGIAKRNQQVSGEVLQVQQGALYPALHRLEQQGSIKAKWMESETGRQAKVYSLTAAGKNQLEEETATGTVFPRPSTW
jgi:hypothetical protein